MSTTCERNLAYEDILALRAAEAKLAGVYYTDLPTIEPTPFEPLMSEKWVMAVGDINSNTKGSGARANEGKTAYDLIPVSVLRNAWRTDTARSVDCDVIMDVMYALDKWQQGNDQALSIFLEDQDLDGAVAVFAYGAKKYAAWNWAKGMQWSVPLGCALRHIRSVLDGQFIDDESGEPHMDHVLCNIIMLQYFLSNYTDGDDRPMFEAGGNV